ncbi:MAG: ABC transporter ATP-binding protein [Burkholderiales bacterium]
MGPGSLRPAAISATGIGVTFGSEGTAIAALKHVDVTVEKGSFVTMLGPSGSGKSTFLRLVADLVQPSEGSIEVLSSTPAEARRRRAIGFVFQDPALLPWRTALQNVELPLQVGRPQLAPHGRRPIELLAAMGLAHRQDALPRQLSGGEQQRVALARALVGGPEILLMDEPFGALDEIVRDRLNELLLGLWRQTGCTVLLVTHSVQEAALLGERVIVMARHGPACTIDTYPRTQALAERDRPEFSRLVARLRQALEDASAGSP